MCKDFTVITSSKETNYESIGDFVVSKQKETNEERVLSHEVAQRIHDDVLNNRASYVCMKKSRTIVVV